MSLSHINRIATAVRPHEVHGAFRAWAGQQITEERLRSIFARLAEKSQIDGRRSVLDPWRTRAARLAASIGRTTSQAPPSAWPATRRRRPPSTEQACLALGLEGQGAGITHLIVATCAGFAAPSLDHWLIRRFGLPGHVERSIVGFMGCQAAPVGRCG